MSIKTTAIVSGVVRSVNTREGVKDGKAWSMTNVLIIGDHSIADATIPRGIGVPKEGDFVTAKIQITTFRGDDSVDLVEYLDPAHAFRVPKAA